MTLLAEIVVAVLILVGAGFAFLGSFGLAKLPDLMTRLHAPTKATTLGIGGMLVASMIHFAVFGDGLSIHELLITVFLFLTAPVTAHMVAKAHLLRDRRQRERLPPTGGAYGWATLDAGPPDRAGAREALRREGRGPVPSRSPGAPP